MRDREYRHWIIDEVFSSAYSWMLLCRDETGVYRNINICRNTLNALNLEKILNKNLSEWGSRACGYTVLNIDVEAIIDIWVEPDENKGQEKFQGFRIGRKYYFFENAYSILTEEDLLEKECSKQYF